MGPGDDLYDAKVTVLSEYIDHHHVKEEEREMFPKARNADLDTGGLGQEMASRKEELKAELAILDNDSPNPPRAKAPNGAKRASNAPR